MVMAMVMPAEQSSHYLAANLIGSVWLLEAEVM
jgi:hypothetical protein